ncbi:hypothetical protein QFC20_005232 [Naganishia adeliensis]|uniref:Uncharacterized protein n=1 Tax=Naganishia adeliensis TaxID=92952 RepID=A0ACC2VR27_9TREE|nr:hypothetical protein QFC20_005232 [Naganishia adeliensis]
MHLGSSSPLAVLALLASSALPSVYAADKEAWRTRSIYQYCGGTWRSIIDKLDYLQAGGWDSVWISPVHQNLEGDTPYGDAFHGFWVTDIHKLNPHFGNAEDLKALSNALHDRGMFLMVDIVVNFAASLSSDMSEASLASQNITFKKPSQYHPLCWIDYSKQESVENCWMGSQELPLMDINTENPEVQETLKKMNKEFVDEYHVDGLRIDAAKHVPGPFWKDFCTAAGVFCTGEVYTDDTSVVAEYQRSGSLDSLLNFPAFNGFKNAFQVPGRANMKDLGESMTDIVSQFPDPGVLGNFLANHDVSRFRAVTASDSVAYNALVWQFTFDGIPITYYGEEQEIASGLSDPDQRQALWAKGMGDYSTNTVTYRRLQRLNYLRKFLMSNNVKVEGGATYLANKSKVIMSSATDLAFTKGPILVVLNNRVALDSPVTIDIAPESVPGLVGDLFDVLNCRVVDLSITLGTTRTGRDPLVSLLAWIVRRIGFKCTKLTTTPCQVIMTKENAAASGLCPDLAGPTPPSTVVPTAAPTTCKRKDGKKKKRSTLETSFGEARLRKTRSRSMRGN